MRVAMLASSYPRFPGDPSGVFIASFAQAVAALGHSVRVVAPADRLAPLAEQVPLPATRFRYSPFRSLQPMGYGKALENDRRLRASAWACAVPYFLSAVAHMLRRRDQWDLIHVHWLLPNGPPGLLAAFLTGKPAVISLHGSDVYLAGRSPILRPLARTCLAAAGAVVACSPDHIEMARTLGADEQKLSLIPWGGDPDRFQCGDPQRWRQHLVIPPDCQVVLALGRLVEKKGFDRLVQAFALVHARAVLLIAGDGPMKAPLVTLAAGLGVAHRVRFAGAVASNDVPDLMALSTVVAVPSVTDSSGNQDGMPTVALEAMAAGRPVVASHAGGLPLVIRNGATGLLVPAGDVPALANAIQRLLDDPRSAQAMGAAGRKRVDDDLHWRTTAERYVEVYKQALEPPRGRTGGTEPREPVLERSEG